MDQLTPILFNYLEEHARPHIQDKVSEELDETKVDLKKDMPDTVIDFLKSEEGFPMIADFISNMGEDFMEKIRKVTDATIETASEGMDLLLTNGVMNISKDVLTSNTDGDGASGLNFDFLKSGKEGMVSTTMVASAPIIKQVSENMGRKISAHFPAQVGGAIQQVIDEHGGSDGLFGKAAGFVARFLMKDDGEAGAPPSSGDRSDRDLQAAGVHTGRVQEMVQKFLGPKVLIMIQPYLQRFEAKMTRSLEGELRGKVFNMEYIQEKVMATLTGMSSLSGNGGLGDILGNILGAHTKGGNDDDDDSGRRGGGGDAMKIFGSLAEQFLKGREH